ncbi:MAG: acyltransferase [Muribaculaceae bacterium]|nr:acyltransferase [Muribaculaceae bacterium]
MRLTSVTYIRAFSAILIFCCHVAFIAGSFEVSFWFNTGVPLFFIISAYLLSLKDIGSHKKFYKRRFRSIFPAYWIYLAAIVAVLFVVGRAPDVKSIVCYSLGLSGLVESCVLGLGHLWFISVLLICYALTPLLHRMIERGASGLLWSIVIVQAVVFFLIGLPAYAIHVASFIYVYTFYNKNKGLVTKQQMTTWICAAVVLSAVRLIGDPIFMAADYTVYYYYDSLYQPIARFGLAMALFTVFIYNSEWIEQRAKKHEKAHRGIAWFSDISYEVYLTHQFILLAFWEFVPAFHSGVGLLVWSVVSFAATIVNALLLTKAKNFITNKLIKI